VHDYIQWLFPLPEPSSANPHAPVLSKHDIEVFRDSRHLRKKLVQSLEMMLRFYGLELGGPPGSPIVSVAQSYPALRAQWLRAFNHNYLRITRILRSLTILGEQPYARSLLRCLEQIYAENRQVIGDESIAYWRAAVNEG